MATLRRSGFLILGAAITITQLVRASDSVLISLVVGVAVWWLNRRHHARKARHRPRRARHLREQVITAGIVTAGIWLAFMAVRAGYELTDMLTAPDGGAPGLDGFPGRMLLEGLLATIGLTYLMLAMADQPRRRRRRVRSRRREPIVQSSAPEEA